MIIFMVGESKKEVKDLESLLNMILTVMKSGENPLLISHGWKVIGTDLEQKIFQ